VSVNACAALVEAGDPDRFLAAMAAPASKRGALFVLYALNLEVAKAPFVTQEPMIAEMRLQFWRDVVADAVAGKQPRAHEVAGPLADVIRDKQLPAEMLDQMIAARRFDIYPDDRDNVPFDLEEFVARTAGNLMVLSALVCGMDAARCADAQRVGAAMGMALWFQAVPALVGHQRVAAGDLDSDIIVQRAQKALAGLQSARRVDFGVATPALRAAWQTKPILRQAAQDPRRAVDGALGISEFRKRAGLLLRSLTERW